MKKLILLLIPALAITLLVKGQQAFQNYGNLHIHTGGSLSVKGNFTNTSDGVLANYGSLFIAGEVTNHQATMATGSGTLYVNGSLLQTIYGSYPMKTFNLVTDNASGFMLNNNLHITGQHIFTQGSVGTSSTPNYLVYEAGSSYLGTNDNRHVTGWVKKKGTTDFSFPVGNGSYNRSVSIKNLSAYAEINSHYYQPTQNISSVTIPVRMVKANEFWQINMISGGTARVELNWDHARVPMDNILLADIISAQYTTGSWNSAGGIASGNVTTTGTVTSDPLSTFGPFTLGYKTFPLPLKLISFSGERRNGSNYLDWITDNEEGVSRFEIERSFDAMRFSRIGELAAKNTGNRQQYKFEDKLTLDGIAWYRLRIVDQDSKYAYSPIIFLTDKVSLSHTFLVSNPVKSSISILNKTGQTGVFDYRLTSSAGLVVMSGKIGLSLSSGSLLPLPSYTVPGIYILELTNKDVNFRQKLVVVD